MAEKPLLVLDVETTDPRSRELWEQSRLLERVGEVCPAWVLWDPGSAWRVPGATSFSDFSDLLAYAKAEGAQALVLVEGGQVFLDVAISLEGLRSFHPERIDYFTQWEHCRLPVGAGVRAISVRSLERMSARSPMECLEQIRLNPADFKYHYDVAHEVSFEESLLDCQDSAALRRLLAAQSDGWSWDTAGFLGLVRRTPEMAPRYVPPFEAPRVDERKMPAAYGFESPECAEFPTYIMFDVVNVCNARCVHCPQSIANVNGSKPDFLAEPGHLSLDLFKRVIDECAGRPLQFVRITADGEPLVHKQLFDMIEYAAGRGVGPVGLTTNGSLLTPEKSKRLLQSGLYMIDFSLDAATAETFAKVRAGLKFDKVRRNVHEFIDLRDRLGAPVKVMVSFVKQRANIHELSAFVDYWTPLVDKVLIREMISNVGLNETSESAFPGWDHRWPCVHFFRRVVINHQGVLKACPIDWEQKTVYRSMTETSVYDAWHSHHYWLNRLEHLNDEIPDRRVCKKCKDWAGTPWEMGYEKVIAQLE